MKRMMDSPIVSKTYTASVTIPAAVSAGPGAESWAAAHPRQSPFIASKTIVEVQPERPFIVHNVRLVNADEGLEIDYVQVGNYILAAFAKRHPICEPGMRIVVFLKNRSPKELVAEVEVEGEEPPEDR